MKRCMTAFLLLALVLPAAQADETLEKALEGDVVLRALVDELGRSMNGLELEDLERPYFIEYGLQDMKAVWVTAEYGAITAKNDYHARSLSTDVRVGSYELDNSNFGGGGYYGMFSRMMGGGSSIPVENDYDAIRQAIWWTTDRDYKNVVEQLEKKKAFMKSKMIEDKPDDFSREEPVVHIENLHEGLGDPLDEFVEAAKQLSAVFNDYPDLKDTGVSIALTGGNKYLVNTEGTRIRTGGMRLTLSVMAETQAEDGMELSDSFTVTVREKDDTPELEELEKRCHELAERLLKVRKAPVLDEAYTGPVLFEAEVAAEVFAGNFASRFAGGQRPVGSRTSPDDFANKLDRRILPRYLNVIDDPTQERIGDKPVMGHYKYDDEGVRAQPVQLVENGKLKSLLMSRNPSKHCDKSNGHGRGYYGGASIGCLIVSGDETLSKEELRQELIDAAQDEGLDFAIRIASAGGSTSQPLEIYKVFPDGREELVRGAEIASFDLKAFKRMLGVGDEPHVANSGGRMNSTTIVAPAMLFEELDLAKIDRDFDKPPILENPFARKP